MNPSITAHRGSSSESPENTISAMELAISQGADYIEMDIQQTKDGKLVVCHDTNLKRLTGMAENLWELTQEELQTKDVGSWFSHKFAGAKIPTLEEVLALTQGKIKLNLELKLHGYESDLASEVVKVVGKDFDGVISSFDYPTLVRVKELNPKLYVGLIMATEVADLPQLQVDFYSVKARLATKEFITKALEIGRKVHVWTVNEPEAIQEMIARGVDNIISDHPKLAKLVREKTF